MLCFSPAAAPQRDPHTVVFLIESSPANLDPRVGTDAQSEHIDELLFDGLVARDANFHFTPALAEKWDQPDSRTLVFHLRDGVHFHDGRPLTARDVQWTINSMRNGTVISPKAATYASVNRHRGPRPAHRRSSISSSRTIFCSPTSPLAPWALFPQAAGAISGGIPSARARSAL